MEVRFWPITVAITLSRPSHFFVRCINYCGMAPPHSFDNIVEDSSQCLDIYSCGLNAGQAAG